MDGRADARIVAQRVTRTRRHFGRYTRIIIGHCKHDGIRTAVSATPARNETPCRVPRLRVQRTAGWAGRTRSYKYERLLIVQ
eukprot:4694479-Prymnesium_polylepis.1